MSGVAKRDFRRRKSTTTRAFKGKRKQKRKSAKSTAAPLRQQNGDALSSIASAGQSSSSDFITDASNFVSASEKKLLTFQDSTARSGRGASAVICEVEILTQLVSGAVCGACGTSELAVVEAVDKRKGLASLLELKCMNDGCPADVVSSAYSSHRAASAASRENRGPDQHKGSARDSFAINIKAVLAARTIGVGHDQLSRFCAILGLPKALHHKTFHGISKKVHVAATKAVSDNLVEARRVTALEAGQTDVAVMFDGTWQKRGHKSHNGVGTAISIDTGLCLDFEVLSNYCHGCSRHQILDEQDEEVWQAFHGPVCEKNVNCSSHAMETEAALRIWKRTQSCDRQLHYTTFLSDGDSKAYTAVSEAEVYGSTMVMKEDCTNHVAKRLGTALRKLKVPLPRGEKLSDKIIQKLQTYYQVAITNNRGSIHGMYCAIWASYCIHAQPMMLAVTSSAPTGKSRGVNRREPRLCKSQHQTTPHS